MSKAHSEDQSAASTTGKGLSYAPWERTFERILTPFEEFIRRQTTSGLLLMATAVVALILANNGLMSLFFFVFGMELKREMLVGELADVREPWRLRQCLTVCCA